MKSSILSNAPVTAELNQVSESVLWRHLNSFNEHDLQTMMTDYTEESVLVTPDAVYTGIREISGFLAELMNHFPKGHSTFELDKLVVNDELVYILWHAITPTLVVTMATDTFIIQKGKIHRQTFAGQLKFL